MVLAQAGALGLDKGAVGIVIEPDRLPVLMKMAFDAVSLFQFQVAPLDRI